VGEVQLSGEQVATIARWSCAGDDMASVSLADQRPRWALGWERGDVIAIQSDAHLHLAADGVIKGAVPPVDLAGSGDGRN
jgi:hypothetical protein